MYEPIMKATCPYSGQITLLGIEYSNNPRYSPQAISEVSDEINEKHARKDPAERPCGHQITHHGHLPTNITYCSHNDLSQHHKKKPTEGLGPGRHPAPCFLPRKWAEHAKDVG